jgi:hypothetical protein
MKRSNSNLQHSDSLLLFSAFAINGPLYSPPVSSSSLFTILTLSFGAACSSSKSNIDIDLSDAAYSQLSHP